MRIGYATYLDKVLGGWIGKSIGGTIGDRFEGDKRWIDITLEEAFPKKVPPNDDLDLQIVWLKALEDHGAALSSDDLARAWLENCFYPFNEYGNFRRNWRLGIAPPESGRFDNELFETGMGCPIRSEIWGYIFPGAPDLAARYAALDGTLDHNGDSVWAEQMLSAMAADAFFIDDVRTLIDRHLHHLPADCTAGRLARAAIAGVDEGLDLRTIRERLILLAGHPEPCDARLNVPFTILGLLTGGGDLGKSLLNSLKCGYDTDCTMATAGALMGQILGARAIPDEWKDPVGDELVMGIEYRREEMTLSALARDTARVGVDFARTGVNPVAEIADAPKVRPLPRPRTPAATLNVEYLDAPSAAPGDSVRVRVHVALGTATNEDLALAIKAPAAFTAEPARIAVLPEDGRVFSYDFTLHCRPDVARLPHRNLFDVQLRQGRKRLARRECGIAGAMLWRLLWAGNDPVPVDVDEQGKPVFPPPPTEGRMHRKQYYVRLDRDYIGEDRPAPERNYRRMSALLGRPALLAQYGLRLRPEGLVGIQTEYAAYLYAEFESPAAREAYLIVGHNDAVRVWFNGEMAIERDMTPGFYVPYQSNRAVRIKRGRNRILLKALRRTESLDLSLGFREKRPGAPGLNHCDWLVDLEWVNPPGERA